MVESRIEDKWTPPERPIGVAILGLGARGASFARRLSALPGVDLRWFADLSLHNESVEIQAFGTQTTKSVSLIHVCEILQARSEEILEMVALELKRAGYLDKIAAGLVLTGGSAQLRGFAEVAESRLGIPARVAKPHGYSGLSDLIGTPAYATSIGLVEYALAGREHVFEAPSAGFENPAGGILRRIASIGRALMPE